MATEKTGKVGVAGTNVEVDAAFEKIVWDLDQAEAAKVARSEQAMLETAVAAMDEAEQPMH